MFEWMLKSFPALRGRWTGQNFSSSRQNFLRAQKTRLKKKEKRKKKATGLKKATRSSLTPNVPKVWAAASEQPRCVTGTGEPIQRRLSAGGAGPKAARAPVLLRRASLNGTVALRAGSAGRTGEPEAGGLNIQTLAHAPRRRPEERSLLQPRSFRIPLLLQSWTPLLCLPTPPPHPQPRTINR